MIGLLESKWKAVAALVITLLGGLAQLFPLDTTFHTIVGMITMVAATVGVYAAPKNVYPSPLPMPGNLPLS